MNDSLLTQKCPLDIITLIISFLFKNHETFDVHFGKNTTRLYNENFGIIIFWIPCLHITQIIFEGIPDYLKNFIKTL